MVFFFLLSRLLQIFLDFLQNIKYFRCLILLIYFITNESNNSWIGQVIENLFCKKLLQRLHKHNRQLILIFRCWPNYCLFFLKYLRYGTVRWLDSLVEIVKYFLKFLRLNNFRFFSSLNFSFVIEVDKYFFGIVHHILFHPLGWLINSSDHNKWGLQQLEIEDIADAGVRVWKRVS